MIFVAKNKDKIYMKNRRANYELSENTAKAILMKCRLISKMNVRIDKGE